MRACLVRYVLDLSGREARQAFFRSVAKAQGQAFVDVLRDEVVAAWRETQSAEARSGRATRQARA